ncbi:unnamed protein product [Ectocarpus sp. 12 AP-2014]
METVAFHFPNIGSGNTYQSRPPKDTQSNAHKIRSSSRAKVVLIKSDRQTTCLDGVVNHYLPGSSNLRLVQPVCALKYTATLLLPSVSAGTWRQARSNSNH